MGYLIFFDFRNFKRPSGIKRTANIWLFITDIIKIIPITLKKFESILHMHF